MEIFFKFCVCHVTLLTSRPDISEDYQMSKLSSPADYQTIWSYFYPSKVLSSIRRFISLSVAKTIAIALVSSRLSYCNSLLYNTANKDIAKLQCVQNCLARVVTRSPRFSRSVPLLKLLHWVRVHYHIIFKKFTITYQALSSTQPAYLNSIQQKIPDSYAQLVATLFIFLG